MAIWAQIGDERVTSIPPDGRTRLDIYATFSFAGAALPAGTQVTFLIGTGGLPQAEEGTDPVWTLDLITGGITPVNGIQLSSESGSVGFEVVGQVEERVVRDGEGKLVVSAAAKCSILPISDVLANEFSIIAYSNFDKLGTVERLQPQQVSITVMEGEGVFLSVGERYDPVLDEWTSIAAMPTGRAGPFTAAVGSKLYAIGGFNGKFSDANEEYDPSTDTWAKKDPLPIARGYGSAVVYGGEIYVIGGYNFDVGRASSLVHKYDPSSDSWTQLSSMPIPVSHGTAQEIGGNIYVMFGASRFKTNLEEPGKNENIEKFNYSVMKYDISMDEWSIENVDVTPVLTPPSGTLPVAATAGQEYLSVQTSLAFPPYGILSVGSEVVSYESYDASNGIINLSYPLSSGHLIGETMTVISLPETRIGSNSFADGTDIKIYNGLSYSGFDGKSSKSILGAISVYDTTTKAFSETVTGPDLPRYRGGEANLDVSGFPRSYVVGGSAAKSDFLDEVEYFDLTGGTFSGIGLAQMTFARNSIGVAPLGGYIYAVGGDGSGHPPGWLQIQVTASPQSIRADGRQSAGILITALDASGDPPPDGTLFRVSGIVYAELTEDEQAAVQQEQASAGAVESSTGGSGLPEPAQKISILPVLFSSRDTTMADGLAGTVLLPRSEDPIREVNSLISLLKSGEAIGNQEQLKEGQSEDQRSKTQVIGESRTLYNAAIEVQVIDDFFFGTSDTDAAIAGASEPSLSSADGDFSFNPPSAEQGLSATVGFFSDITSIPDVQSLTDEPVSGTSVKTLLDREREVIPFGSSPHYDALVAGARKRSILEPVLPINNIMLSTSDNDENSSSFSAADVVEEVNDVDGAQNFPVFVNTFIVTDPISLAARRARTDVADLELISSETGGNSFSVVDPSFVDFVIERIKVSAPASMGSGLIIGTKEFDGTLVSARIDVEGVPGNPGSVAGYATNSAELRIFTSLDGYNFEDAGVVIGSNTTFSFSSPIRAKQVRYEVTLRSPTFDSPILTAVTLNFIEDNVQYIFTLPQTVSGQVSEMAAVANYRLPDGSRAEIGLFHGDSVMFDRDYSSKAQPAVTDRGTIVAVNRSFDTFIGPNSDESTRDQMTSEDLFVYTSKSGPWSQEGIARVFVNELEELPAAYVLVPERGVVVFRKRRLPTDKVTLEVQLPSTFRIGIKIVNPAPQSGKFDEFAFMYGETEDDSGFRSNRPPRAANLFITPSPVVPGGPVEANYTFVDPEGDTEDEEQTEINWFRNGVLVPELRNLKSFTNSDLIAKRADSGPEALISKGQEWFFTVRPSDGKAFGPLAVSHKIFVSNQAPTAVNQRLQSSNSDAAVFTSSDTVTAVFDFIDEDKGDAQGDTIYTFFVNGVEIKSGSEASIGPDETDSTGAKLLRPGNTIRADITPFDGVEFGVPVSTDSITVTGTPPSADNVSIIPAAPTTSSKLTLTFKLMDVDGGQDVSTVAWFRNGTRVSELDNSRTVSPILTAPGQQWFAVLTPNNGFKAGDPVKSNVVVIQF